MSSPIVVPFNFQPVAVSVITGSYPIPAGRYAKVTVNLIGNSTFTIGGATALSCTQHSVLASDSIGYDAGVSSLTAPGGAGSAFSENQAVNTLVADLWLPSGTVINGTGTWRAIVQEFNNIT